MKPEYLDSFNPNKNSGEINYQQNVINEKLKKTNLKNIFSKLTETLISK